MPVLGIDIGGSKVAGALISDTGAILMRDNVQLDGSGGSDVGTLIKSLMTSLLKDEETVSKAGVSVPGIAYPGSGTVWADS